MRYRSFIITLSLALLLVACTSSRRAEKHSSPSDDIRAHALRHIASLKRPMFQVAAAKLRLGIDTGYAMRVVDTLLANPTGDMFWLYPAAGFYFYCGDLLDDGVKKRFRATLKSYTPYRGDTENHFLMYYGALLLFSQEWPDMQAGEWFNGKSSHENYAEAKEYLEHWIDETARHGLTEWDSPRYLYFYLTPLLTLRDFTSDTLLRKRFDMMIEYQLADFAAEYLEGSYCGAHSRDGDNSVIDPRNSEATCYGQFYFEDSLSLILPDLSYASMSRFELPEIIRDIAHDRSRPFEHRELKRSRAKIRFARERYTPVYKYTWMTSAYSLGSMQGGIQQPIQQHSWDVTFASGRKHNTIFGLHPQHSPIELGMFFPENPELMVASVAATKGTYVSEDKWIGGSFGERIVQHKGTLAAFYDLGADSIAGSIRHVDLFIPKTLDAFEEDRSGWIFCRMEDAFVAIHPFNREYQLGFTPDSNRRLRSNVKGASFDGYVIDCASKSDMSYEEFRRARAADGVSASGTGAARTIRLRSVMGDALEIRDPEGDAPALFVNGTEVRRESPLLFDGPHLKSVAGSGVIEIRCNGRTRVLDFR